MDLERENEFLRAELAEARAGLARIRETVLERWTVFEAEKIVQDAELGDE